MYTSKSSSELPASTGKEIQVTTVHVDTSTELQPSSSFVTRSHFKRLLETLRERSEKSKITDMDNAAEAPLAVPIGIVGLVLIILFLVLMLLMDLNHIRQHLNIMLYNIGLKKRKKFESKHA